MPQRLLRRPAHAAAGVALFVSTLALTGCSRSHPDRVTPDGTAVQSRMAHISWLSKKHVELTGRPAKSQDEISVFGRNLPSVEGGPTELTDVFLVSPRDQEMIVVRYDAIAAANDGKEVILAHEKKGVGGRRFVVYYPSGRVEQLADDAFEKAMSGPKAK